MIFGRNERMNAPLAKQAAWPMFALPALALLMGLGETQRVAAQQAAPFYQHKTITMLIGGAVGGGYDGYARTFARYFSKHIPGEPGIIPKNLPAGGGLVSANTLARADKDGLTIGAFPNNIPTEPLFKNPAVTYDARTLNWLGSLGKLQNICATWHDSPIKTIAAAQKNETIVAAAGATSNTVIIPKVLNALLDTKFKVVPGYDGGGGLTMAVERGEAQGICGLSWSTIKASRPHWIKDNLLNVLVQVSLDKLPDLQNVPSALDLVSDPQKKKVLELILVRQETGRPFAAPAGVPAERIAILRQAFADTLKDPAFLEDAEKQQMEIDPLSGSQIQKLIDDAYATPEDIVVRAAELLNPPDAK